MPGPGPLLPLALLPVAPVAVERVVDEPVADEPVADELVVDEPARDVVGPGGGATVVLRRAGVTGGWDVGEVPPAVVRAGAEVLVVAPVFAAEWEGPDRTYQARPATTATPRTIDKVRLKDGPADRT